MRMMLADCCLLGKWGFNSVPFSTHLISFLFCHHGSPELHCTRSPNGLRLHAKKTASALALNRIMCAHELCTPGWSPAGSA